MGLCRLSKLPSAAQTLGPPSNSQHLCSRPLGRACTLCDGGRGWDGTRPPLQLGMIHIHSARIQEFWFRSPSCGLSRADVLPPPRPNPACLAEIGKGDTNRKLLLFVGCQKSVSMLRTWLLSASYTMIHLYLCFLFANSRSQHTAVQPNLDLEDLLPIGALACYFAFADQEAQEPGNPDGLARQCCIFHREGRYRVHDNPLSLALGVPFFRRRRKQPESLDVVMNFAEDPKETPHPGPDGIPAVVDGLRRRCRIATGRVPVRER